MAKGEKKDEPKEDYEFVPPDFDEDAFIHKELVSFKTTATLILVGIAAAVLSWLAFGPVGGEDIGWLIGLGVFLAAFLALKPLYRLFGFDIGHYGRREWIGSAFLLFFTWLAFFMILLNPPFSDHAAPTLDIHASPSVAAAGQDVRIDVFVTDNDRVDSAAITVQDAAGQTIAATDDFEDLDNGHFVWRARDLPAGEYRIDVEGKDRAGRTSQGNGTFSVAAEPIEVVVGDLTTRAGEIFVTVPAGLDVWGVYADPDHDASTPGGRVYFEYHEGRDGWVAASNYEGWNEGTNNVTIFIEERNRFVGQTLVRGGILSDGPYEVEVTEPGDYAKGRPRANPTDPPNRNVPALEVPLLLAGLGAVALALRRRA